MASGGVWRTTTWGNTFTPVFDKQGSFSIGCVAIDPNDPGAVYLQGGVAISLGPPVTRLGLAGTRIVTQATKSITGVTGTEVLSAGR